ncbi:MAG TPA: tail fiber domain-containing protein [Candidatus Obscuribacterales bacterium]
MTFSYEKRSPGDVLSSQDWNAAMQEIVRMETAKVNRNGADTLKGPLTIAEALTVSGNMGLGKPASSDVRLDIKGDLRVTEGSINANLLVRDTRDVNDSPTAFDRVVSFDFKKRDVVGAPGEGNFSGMLTLAPWTDNSGDAHHQLNFNEGGIFWRQGQPDATSWDQWRRIPHEGMTSSFTLQGNLGVGLTNPGQALVINSAFNSGRQAGSGMTYGGAIAISSNAPQIDFIDTDAGQGDWAIHVNSSKLYFVREPWNYQDLVLDGVGRVGIGTDTPQAKLQVVGGAIMPSVGNSATAGIFFPTDPGGGGGDAAWLRYYMRSGESGTLELGISNDGDDHLALMASGGVGIGTNTPSDTLEVRGNVRMLTHSNPLRFTSGWSSFTDTSVNAAEISNDTSAYKKLMIVGNRSADNSTRRVGIWDRLDVHGLIVADSGITTPQIRQPNGRFYLALQDDRNFVMYDGGRAVWATGTNTSDIALKEKITTIPNALEKLLSLRGVFFFWKDGALGDEREIGVIAQEVEQAFPELMQTLGKNQKLVQYDKFAPILIEAIREQQQLIQNLQMEVASLKKQLKDQ